MLRLPTYHLSPLFWLIVSLLLYLAGSHARQLLERTRWRAWAGRYLDAAPAGLVIQLVYYVGVPYLALWRGDLLPRLMGLADLHWIEDSGLSVAFAAATIILALVALRWAGGTLTKEGVRQTESPAALWPAIVSQCHWTFYRASLAQAMGDLYLGAFLSLAPLGFELALNPAWRRRLRGAGAAREALRLALLVTTTAQYVLARNLALLALTHWLTEFVVVAALAAWPPRKRAGNN